MKTIGRVTLAVLLCAVALGAVGMRQWPFPGTPAKKPAAPAIPVVIGSGRPRRFPRHL